MHKLAEPHIGFVNFCAQIKNDVVLLLDLAPRVHSHLGLLQVERNDKDLTIVFLRLRNHEHLLNIALWNEVVLLSTPGTFIEYELLEFAIFFDMALRDIFVLRVYVIEVYDVCMLARCDVRSILVETDGLTKVVQFKPRVEV